MKISREQSKQIEEILNSMECSKDFKCYKSQFNNLCKARDLEMEKFLECLDKKPQKCEFSFPFGTGHFCSCPLRFYTAKNLGK